MDSASSTSLALKALSTHEQRFVNEQENWEILSTKCLKVNIIGVKTGVKTLAIRYLFLTNRKVCLYSKHCMIAERDVKKMATLNITEADFEEKVLKTAGRVIVDFWAEWCGPCKLAEPALEELSETYKGKVQIVKMNVDENPNTPAKYSVLSIPTTILFKGGQEMGRQIGFGGKQPFEDLIKKAL